VLGSAKGIVVRDSDSYLKGLERQGVTVDPQRRRRTIEEQIAGICKSTGFRLNIDADLLDQAVYTTECPNAIIGSFKETYLDVPEEILITSMKEHQGFFSLMHKETGKLVPHFIAVANNRAKDMGLIREGNERVLAARLADAKFFFDEDRKIKLEERAKKLAGVTFHKKLGTMAQKVERVIQLAVKLAETQQDHGFVENCRRAAQLSKADLLTGIVGEFPALQGVMGGHYASHDGEPEAVGRAIREHYLPHAMEGALPQTLEGKILSLADRLDTVVGFFSVGMIPTGSEDPFALRRHAMAIVLIYIDLGWPTDLNRWIGTSHEILRAQGCSSTSASHADGKAVVAGVNSFFADRLRFYSKTARGLRDDVIEAVLGSAKHEFIPADLLKKMEALQGVRDLSEFDSLMIGFKRAHRLVEKEQWDRKPVDEARFEHPTESALYQAISEEREKMKSAMTGGDYDQALDSLVRLKPAIDAFFTAVMVNAEDPAIRSNRLSLLREVDDFFNSFADFSQIVVQGS
jgi:glycyl-tRNA synthetase beta chain